MPPIITRAVLVDVAGYKGVDVLPDAYMISAEEVQGALAAQNTTVTPGTAVLIRTGFYQHLASGNRAYSDAQAGIGLDAAKWLHQQGMILAGADNMGVEAMPPWDHSVHRYLLVHNGVTHLEVLYLDELAAKKDLRILVDCHAAAPPRFDRFMGTSDCDCVRKCKSIPLDPTLSP